MNILIVSDKADVKTYKSILKSAPNTSVLGAVTTITNDFVSEIKEKYHPHALLFDTSVPTKNTTVSDTISVIHDLYPYIKTIVLTDENDTTEYPAYAVINGQISNIEFNSLVGQAQQDLDKVSYQTFPVTPDKNNNENIISTKEKTLVKNKDLDKSSKFETKIPKPKFTKKRTHNRNIKTPLITAIICLSAFAVITAVCLGVKSCKSADLYASKTDEAITTEQTEEIASVAPTTYQELIVNFTDVPTVPSITVSQNATEKNSIIKNDKKNSSVENGSPSGKTNNNNSSSSNSSSSVTSSNKQTSKNDSNNSVSYNDNKYNNSQNNKISSIKISYASKTLKVDEYINLSASTYPIKKTVKWTSSNSSVASVNSNGKVIAKNPGKATITATADGVKANCIITVNPMSTNPKPTNPKPTVAPTTEDPIKLSATSYKIAVGQIIYINLINSTNCSWKISNPAVVQICGGGSNKIMIKGIKAGETTITATDSSTRKNYICKVSIK